MSILLVGIVGSLVILIRSHMHYHSLTTNMPVFLTCNTYVMLLLTSLVMFEFYASTLYGDLHPSVDMDSPWCFARYYVICICLSAILYSYNLQAIFRLYRVVFYQRKNLQSFRLFRFALVGQWFLAILSILPQIILKYAEYFPQERNCQLSFTNIRAFFIVLFCSHYIPLNVILLIYITIIRYTRWTTHALQKHRRLANDRDTIVLRRIITLLLTLFITALPTLIIATISWTTNYLTPLAYQIQGLSLSSNLATQVIVLAFLTPHTRGLLRRNGIRVLSVKVTKQIPLATVKKKESIWTASDHADILK